MSDLILKPDPGLDLNTDPKPDCKPNSDSIREPEQISNPKANPDPQPTNETEPKNKADLTKTMNLNLTLTLTLTLNLSQT